MPADTHSAATHHMTAAVTRTSHRMAATMTRTPHRMAAAMMPASTANGVTPAMSATVAAATHGVAATMASSSAVTTALLGVGEGRDRNGEKCGKRDARKAGHGWNLHGPVRPNENARRDRWVPAELLRVAGRGDPRAHRFVGHPSSAGPGIVGHMVGIAGSRYRAGDGGMTDDELEQEL